MTRHSRVGFVNERDTSAPSSPAVPDPDVLQRQVRALAAAVEQLADAVDVLTDPDTPSAYADEHVRRAREALGAAWSG